VNLRLLVLMAYCLAIFLVSSIPGSQLGTPAPDYLMHGLEYLILGFLTLEWLKSTRAPSLMAPLALALAAWGLSSLYGALDEIHQYFTPGRFCDPRDWFSDTMGAALGIAGQVLKDNFFESRRPNG